MWRLNGRVYVMCQGVGRARTRTQIFSEPTLWNPNSWHTRHSVPRPHTHPEETQNVPNVGYYLELYFQHKKAKKGQFCIWLFFRPRTNGSNIYLSFHPTPSPLKLVGLPLLSSDARPEGRRGKNKKNPQASLPSAPHEAAKRRQWGLHPLVGSGIRWKRGPQGELEGSFLKSGWVVTGGFYKL